MADDGGEEKAVMGEESFVHMPYWRYFREGVLLHGWQNRVPQDPQPGPFRKKGEGPTLPQGKPIESKFSHYYKSSYQNDYLTNIPKDGSFAHQLNEFVNQTEQILGYPGKDPTCTSSHDRWSDKFRHASEYMFEFSHPEILKDPCKAIFGHSNPPTGPKDPECETFCPAQSNSEEEEEQAIEREKTERKIALFSKPLSRPPF